MRWLVLAVLGLMLGGGPVPAQQPEKEITNSIGMKLLLIPKGSFTMGAEDGFVNEQPTHPVTISQPFYLGVYEVTQEQYEGVMGENPSKFKDPKNPVGRASWQDAVEFCRKLSELPDEKSAGRVYRLPTEAEWEYACRAGSTTKFGFGDDESQLFDYAWIGKNSESKTHHVGQKKPNAWGIHDMHGNAWEWCSDWYGEYPRDAVTDPQGPDTGIFRTCRGGSWGFVAANCRSAARGANDPATRTLGGGFRVVLKLSDNSPKTEHDKDQ
jgi:formylglycine-generating enzyme required for sulfatase activity